MSFWCYLSFPQGKWFPPVSTHSWKIHWDSLLLALFFFLFEFGLLCTHGCVRVCLIPASSTASLSQKTGCRGLKGKLRGTQDLQLASPSSPAFPGPGSRCLHRNIPFSVCLQGTPSNPGPLCPSPWFVTQFLRYSGCFLQAQLMLKWHLFLL